MTSELEHRVKNTLAMVAALANQTFRSTDSTATAREVLGGRIKALSAAHDALHRTSWRQAPLRSVVESALAPHDSGEHRIRISGPNVALTSRQALALSLALNELATNAAKYGALSGDTGHIEVSWRLEGPRDKGEFRLEWREIG